MDWAAGSGRRVRRSRGPRGQPNSRSWPPRVHVPRVVTPETTTVRTRPQPMAVVGGRKGGGQTGRRGVGGVCTVTWGESHSWSGSEGSF